MTLPRPITFESLRQGPSDVEIEPVLPVKVSVLVSLMLRPDAGGHVKCWQRIGEAATAFPDAVDLTVHFTGEEEAEHEVAPNVRFRTWRPVFGTERLPFLSAMPDHTDLAGFHPRLAQALDGCDVIHTTDAFFSFAQTALSVSNRGGTPIVNSIHTDTPGYSRIFTSRAIESLIGRSPLTSLLVDRLGIGRRVEREMKTKLKRHQALSSYTLVSRPDDHRLAQEVLPPSRIWTLRRGVDTDFFTPHKRDRAWLRKTYGIPEYCFVVLYAGRVNRGKNVGTVVEALGRLREPRRPVHFICAGQGEDRPAIEAMLGPDVTCPGMVPQEDLARLYASADIFAFPSMIEISSNVVREALASGLPVLAAFEGTTAADIDDGNTGLLLPGKDAETWRRAIEALARDPGRVRDMSRAAHRWAKQRLPSWKDVLIEDLLPVWCRAAAEAARPAA